MKWLSIFLLASADIFVEGAVAGVVEALFPRCSSNGISELKIGKGGSKRTVLVKEMICQGGWVLVVVRWRSAGLRSGVGFAVGLSVPLVLLQCLDYCRFGYGE